MKLSLFWHKASLKNKLSIIIAVAVMLVALVLGIYFDSFLKNSSLETAHGRMFHAYQRLDSNLKNIEKNLKAGISFIQSDEQMLASIDLINNYQDKKNYNSYLIDEEKKAIASQLLSRVKLSFNDEIAVYDKNFELVAFVTKEQGNYQLAYVSYIKSRGSVFKRNENKQEYEADDIHLNFPLQHKSFYNTEHSLKTSLITYQHTADRIIVMSHKMIHDAASKQPVGHIEVSRIISRKYFEQLSQTLDLDIKFSFDSGLDRAVQLLEKNIDSKHFDIMQSDQRYTAILKQNSFDGDIYYHTSFDKTPLNILLNQSRNRFLMILIFVTVTILLLMRYMINRILDLPLSVLKKQINKIEHQDYSESQAVLTGDELETVSVNINQLARAVQEREDSLNKSMQEQYQLSIKVKASETHLRTLVQSLPDLVWLKDAEGFYLSCNPKFERLFGNKESEIVGKTDYDFVDKELADFFRKHDKQAMAAGKPTLNEEEVTYADDGHKELTETVKTPMYAPDGTLIGVLGVGRDITERRQTEEQLRRTQKMDALGKLTGGIAHDYNNMLGVILGYSEIIEEIAREQPKLTEYINHIKHAGERGAKLTKKLLTFSRQQSSDKKIVNLNTLLEDSQLMLEKTLTVRISLVYELEKNLWSINLDESDLEDAILNMSINAMHAIEGNGQITFETRNEAIKEIDTQHLQIPAGDYVLLSITDTGCGMDNKTKENIFDPFFSTKGELGTGLGLSQVYGLAQREKGNIKIYSELGQGSRFTLYFPRYYESDIAEKKFEEGEETNLSGKQNIIVIDDEPALAELSSHILTEQGYHVFIANSGKEALLILEKESVDVLFSDVIMPEMDGYELATIVQEKYPNIKIQLASGFNDDRHAGNINASLQEKLLHKPYHSKKLLLRIRELLNGSAD